METLLGGYIKWKVTLHCVLALDDVLQPDGRPCEGHPVAAEPVASIIRVGPSFVNVLKQ